MTNQTTIRCCGFCDRQLEEDEELHPVFIGSPPEPEPMVFTDVTDDPESLRMFLGHETVYLRILLDIIRMNENIEMMKIDRVVENEFIQEDHPDLMEDVDGNEEVTKMIDSWVDTGKSGLKLEVKPDFGQPEPDLEVCPNCESSLASL
jgi:hypothetical protein